MSEAISSDSTSPWEGAVITVLLQFLHQSLTHKPKTENVETYGSCCSLWWVLIFYLKTTTNDTMIIFYRHPFHRLSPPTGMEDRLEPAWWKRFCLNVSSSGGGLKNKEIKWENWLDAGSWNSRLAEGKKKREKKKTSRVDSPFNASSIEERLEAAAFTVTHRLYRSVAHLWLTPLHTHSISRANSSMNPSPSSETLRGLHPPIRFVQKHPPP